MTQTSVLDRAEVLARETSFADRATDAEHGRSVELPWSVLEAAALVGARRFADAACDRAAPSLIGWDCDSSDIPVRVTTGTTRSTTRVWRSFAAIIAGCVPGTHIEYAGATLGTLRLFHHGTELENALDMSIGLGSTACVRRSIARRLWRWSRRLLHRAGTRRCYLLSRRRARRCLTLLRRSRTRGPGAGTCAFARRDRSYLAPEGARITSVTGWKLPELGGRRVVLAAGSFSPKLVESVGIKVPIQPVKGYSITVPMDGAQPAPRIPILDDELHAVAVPLANRMRVAGTAEFTGFDRTVTPARIENLRYLLARTYPSIAQTAARRNALRPGPRQQPNVQGWRRSSVAGCRETCFSNTAADPRLEMVSLRRWLAGLSRPAAGDRSPPYSLLVSIETPVRRS